MSDMNDFGQEWRVLQNNYEQYERNALLIKLTAVVLCMSGFALEIEALVMVAMMFILWIQEAIFRTCQSRLGDRIVRVEQQLSATAQKSGTAFQLHSEWQATRPGVVGLLSEYLSCALKPTVAFPYAVLLLITFVLNWM